MHRKAFWFFGWIFVLLVSITVPMQARSPLSGFADPGGGQHWTFMDNDGHVYNVFWTAEGGYGFHDVTAASGAPPAAANSSVSGFADPGGGQHWTFIDSDGHVYNAFRIAEGEYGFHDVTVASGAPPAAANSSVSGFADPGGGQHWTFIDSDGHVYNAFRIAEGEYGFHDVTVASGAPPAAANSPLSGFADPGGGQHWTFIDNDRHVYNVFWTAEGGYGFHDVTVASGAPPAAANSPLSGFADPGGGQHWTFIDNDRHVYNVFWTAEGGYGFHDVTAASGAPPAAANSPLSGFADPGGGQHWTFIDSDGHVYNIFWTAEIGYDVHDATAASGAPPAAANSPLSGFADPGGGQHWTFIDSDGHVYNIFWTLEGGYAVHDVTAASGAPPAA